MRALGPLPWFGLVTVVFAGCVGSQASPAAHSGAPAAAQPGTFDETTGAIAGLVTDPEFVPIAGADVSLKEVERVTQSAADGTFTFSKLPPAAYTLFAVRLGYEAGVQKVTVTAGHPTEGVKLVLNPLAIVEARVAVFQFKGYITCTIGYSVVLSEECGQGLQTSYGTFGGNPNNHIDWRWNNTDVKDLKTMHIELAWKPGSAAAKQLDLYVAHKFRCTPGCSVDTANGGMVYPGCGTANHGPPVVKCHIEDLGVKHPEKDLPWSMTARAWGAQVGLTDVPNIVLEQAFDMYRTEFFGEAMPEKYSAVPDQ
jgi:hypothetical protein